MRVKCPKCKTIQRLSQSLEPGELRRIACGKCGVKFAVRKPGEKPAVAPAEKPPASEELPPPLPHELPAVESSGPTIGDPSSLTPAQMEGIGTQPAGAADVLPSSILDIGGTPSPEEDLPFPAQLAPNEPSLPTPDENISSSTPDLPPLDQRPPADESPVWRVRKRDGATMEFPDLQKFQQAALDGLVTVDDELSRNGHYWRQVQEIPELVGLCDRADELKQARTQPYPLNAPPPAFAAVPPTISSTPPLESSDVSLPGDDNDLNPLSMSANELPEPQMLDLSMDSADVAPPLPELDARTEPDGAPDISVNAISDGFESDLLTNLDFPLPEQLDDPAEFLNEAAASSGAPPWENANPDLMDSTPPASESADNAAADAMTTKSIPGEFTNVMLSAMNEGRGGGFVDIGDDPDLFGAPDAAKDLESIIPVMDPLVNGLGVHDLSDNPSLTEAQEMEMAGSTLQMKLPDDQAFELGKAIEMDLAGNDPFGAVSPPSAEPQNIAPPLTPEVEPEPVPAAQPAMPISGVQPPITSDETGGLGMGWIPKLLIALLVQALIGGGIYFYFDSQSKEEPVQPVQSAGETATAAPTTNNTATPQTAPTTKKQPKTIVTSVSPEPIDPNNPARTNAPASRAQRKGLESGLTGALAIAETPKQKRERLKKLAEDKAKEAEKARQLAEAAEAKAQEAQNAKKPPAKTDNKPAKTDNKPAVQPTEKPPRKPTADTERVVEPKPQRPPDSYDGLMSAARKAMKGGASSRALAYLREAAKLNPRSVEPIAKMGWAYLRMNNTSQAIIKFTEAKAKNPGYRNTYIGLGKAFERAGRRSEAIGIYRQYLRICANCRRAESVRAALLRLGAKY